MRITGTGGITTETVRLMVDYLTGDMDIRTIKAFVMPGNVYSVFLKEAGTIQGHNW